MNSAIGKMIRYHKNDNANTNNYNQLFNNTLDELQNIAHTNNNADIDNTKIQVKIILRSLDDDRSQMGKIEPLSVGMRNYIVDFIIDNILGGSTDSVNNNTKNNNMHIVVSCLTEYITNNSEHHNFNLILHSKEILNQLVDKCKNNQSKLLILIKSLEHISDSKIQQSIQEFEQNRLGDNKEVKEAWQKLLKFLNTTNTTTNTNTDNNKLNNNVSNNSNSSMYSSLDPLQIKISQFIQDIKQFIGTLNDYDSKRLQSNKLSRNLDKIIRNFLNKYPTSVSMLELNSIIDLLKTIPASLQSTTNTNDEDFNKAISKLIEVLNEFISTACENSEEDIPIILLDKLLTGPIKNIKVLQYFIKCLNIDDEKLKKLVAITVINELDKYKNENIIIKKIENDFLAQIKIKKSNINNRESVIKEVRQILNAGQFKQNLEVINAIENLLKKMEPSKVDDKNNINPNISTNKQIQENEVSTIIGLTSIPKYTSTSNSNNAIQSQKQQSKQEIETAINYINKYTETELNTINDDSKNNILERISNCINLNEKKTILGLYKLMQHLKNEYPDSTQDNKKEKILIKYIGDPTEHNLNILLNSQLVNANSSKTINSNSQTDYQKQLLNINVSNNNNNSSNINNRNLNVSPSNLNNNNSNILVPSIPSQSNKQLQNVNNTFEGRLNKLRTEESPQNIVRTIMELNNQPNELTPDEFNDIVNLIKEIGTSPNNIANSDAIINNPTDIINIKIKNLISILVFRSKDQTTTIRLHLNENKSIILLDKFIDSPTVLIHLLSRLHIDDVKLKKFVALAISTKYINSNKQKLQDEVNKLLEKIGSPQSNIVINQQESIIKVISQEWQNGKFDQNIEVKQAVENLLNKIESTKVADENKQEDTIQSVQQPSSTGKPISKASANQPDINNNNNVNTNQQIQKNTLPSTSNNQSVNTNDIKVIIKTKNSKDLMKILHRLYISINIDSEILEFLAKAIQDDALGTDKEVLLRVLNVVEKHSNKIANKARKLAILQSFSYVILNGILPYEYMQSSIVRIITKIYNIELVDKKNSNNDSININVATKSKDNNSWDPEYKPVDKTQIPSNTNISITELETKNLKQDLINGLLHGNVEAVVSLPLIELIEQMGTINDNEKIFSKNVKLDISTKSDFNNIVNFMKRHLNNTNIVEYLTQLLVESSQTLEINLFNEFVTNKILLTNFLKYINIIDTTVIEAILQNNTLKCNPEILLQVLDTFSSQIQTLNSNSYNEEKKFSIDKINKYIQDNLDEIKFKDLLTLTEIFKHLTQINPHDILIYQLKSIRKITELIANINIESDIEKLIECTATFNKISNNPNLFSKSDFLQRQISRIWCPVPV